jgi:SAM-dependent methyltransferase
VTAPLRVTEALKARFGRRTLLDLRPLSDRERDERGRCNVCGVEGRFVFNSWVIPDELRSSWGNNGVSLAYTRRESMLCRRCCSSLRVRRIVSVLLDLYGSGAGSMAELVREERFRALDLAEINTIGSVGSLHAFLTVLPRLSFSDYRGSDGLGETIRGVRNEDISRLTYADASFDLLLSSDTLEHVPDFRAALRETRRVLRPGGRHIFTVPIVWSREKTVSRARLDEAGSPVHELEPLYHGRGAGLYRYIPVGTDLLAFTEFGRDLVDHLRDAGFEPEVFDDPSGEDRTGASVVFSARVPD